MPYATQTYLYCDARNGFVCGFQIVLKMIERFYSKLIGERKRSLRTVRLVFHGQVLFFV